MPVFEGVRAMRLPDDKLLCWIGSTVLLLTCSTFAPARVQTDPIPALIKTLQAKDGEVHSRDVNERREESRQPGPSGLKSPRARAAHALGEQGPAAKEA